MLNEWGRLNWCLKQYFGLKHSPLSCVKKRLNELGGFTFKIKIDSDYEMKLMYSYSRKIRADSDYEMKLKIIELRKYNY